MFIHLLFNKHLGWFYSLVIMNNASMTICVQAFTWTWFSFLHIYLQVELLGVMDPYCSYNKLSQTYLFESIQTYCPIVLEVLAFLGKIPGVSTAGFLLKAPGGKLAFPSFGVHLYSSVPVPVFHLQARRTAWFYLSLSLLLPCTVMKVLVYSNLILHACSLS